MGRDNSPSNIAVFLPRQLKNDLFAKNWLFLEKKEVFEKIFCPILKRSLIKLQIIFL